MLPFHGCYSNGTWKDKVVRRFKVMVWREAEGASHKVNLGGGGGGSNFYEGVDPSVFFQNCLLISAYFGVKRIL